MPTILAPEPDLERYATGLDATAAQRVRTVVHAWTAGGGAVQVGRLAIRLLGADAAGRTFTAATVHREPPRLELVRVLLKAHGMDAARWTEWCDERPELRAAGFDPDAKFPTIRLGDLAETAAARLALGVRDLARATSRPGTA